jgi:hypothetical protein
MLITQAELTVASAKIVAESLLLYVCAWSSSVIVDWSAELGSFNAQLLQPIVSI